MRESLRDDSSEKDILNGVRDLGTTQQNAVPGNFWDAYKIRRS
jgi:hypothetical protein